MGWLLQRKAVRKGPQPLVLEGIRTESDTEAARAERPAAATTAPRAANRLKRLPVFRATASDQPRSVASDRFADARLALSLAFTPAQPVIDPALFAGRSDMLTTLIRSIEDQRLHVIAYGERGIGKTSLIHVLSQAAREARYLVSYMSCGADSAFEEAIRAVANSIPLIFHKDYGPSSPEGERGDTLADLLGAAPLSVRQAIDALTKVTGTRVLMVLDEFDRVESSEFRLSIAELIKGLSDRACRVQIMIAGVARNLIELVDHVPSIQRNILALPVFRMTDAEVRELIQIGEERSGLRFEEAARGAVITAANGLPYLASLLSHHAGLEAVGQSRLYVTVADVDASISGALVEQRRRISKDVLRRIGTSMNEGGAAVLASLAQLAGEAFDADELASAWPGRPEGVARTRVLVERLVAERVLLERTHGTCGVTYRFADDGLPIYLWLLAAQSRLRERVPRARDEPRHGVPTAVSSS